MSNIAEVIKYEGDTIPVMHEEPRWINWEPKSNSEGTISIKYQSLDGDDYTELEKTVQVQ